MHGMANTNLHKVLVSRLCLCIFCRSCYQMPSDVGMMIVRPGSLPKSPDSIGLNNSTDTNNFDNRKPRSRGSSPAERGYKKTSVVRNGAGARRSRGNSPGEKSTGTITLPQSTDSEWVDLYLLLKSHDSFKLSSSQYFSLPFILKRIKMTDLYET